jgi:DNA repair protein RecN (Recombination protein N)
MRPSGWTGVLVELAVRDLGVIAELRLVLGPGMTVVTGETGAGKTMVVDAIELLVGGRADPALVRTGAEEAWVEGRFVRGGTAHDTPDAPDEVVVARAIPRSGRSRAYIDGRLATVTELAALGALLVDLHGQHAHQSLLHPAAQRNSLDRFAGVDLAPLRAARVAVHDLLDELGRLGGDERARARELDLVRYQVEEIEAAGITGADEDRELEAEEDVLADAAAHREAAALAVAALSGDGDDAAVDGPASASDGVGAAVAALAGRGPFAAAEERLRALAAEVADVAAELRTAGETIDEDPERLEAVRQRRHLLRELRRKYGETLDDVIAEGDRLRARLAELEGHDARAAELDGELAAARAHEAAIAAEVAAARRARIQANLVELAMPKAVLSVAVEGADPGDDVEVLLAANPGTPPLPLAKVASGGELARTMLALRLVLTDAPPTLVFDEVDAGIGGAAAVAVGRALARLGREHQVLVVTHLPQVAAYADAQVQVAKHSDDEATVSQVTVLDPDERVIELSRMLSGQPDSDAARTHAAELLATAAGDRGR